MSAAAIAIPVFLAFAIFLSWVEGEKKIEKLEDTVKVTTEEKKQLMTEVRSLSMAVDELLKYKREAEEKDIKLRQLEKELNKVKKGAPE